MIGHKRPGLDIPFQTSWTGRPGHGMMVDLNSRSRSWVKCQESCFGIAVAVVLMSKSKFTGEGQL